MVYRTTPKMAGRKQARRAKLLAKAMRIFGRKGFHDTTVPMIVSAADSSTGSFYLYFRNKEHIFAAVLETVSARISAALNDAIAGAGPEVLAQMRAAVEALVQFLAGHPAQARILIVESSGLGKRLEKVRREIVASHTRSVEQALRAASARLPELETPAVASCWVGAVYEAVYRWLEQPTRERLPAERLAKAIAAFNLRGIGAPAATIGDEEVNHDEPAS
jgi:AcrR family transcriptional regulator